jgi:hypothetical protein
MCAIGKYEIMRPPAGRGSTSWSPRASAIRFAWVSCTAFGGPVVPEV